MSSKRVTAKRFANGSNADNEVRATMGSTKNSTKATKNVNTVSVKARKAAELLAAELAAQQATQDAAQKLADELRAAEVAQQAAITLAAIVAAPAPVVTKVADDVFGNRLSSLRCRAINHAIAQLGKNGEAFKSRAITTLTHANDNEFNTKHISEFGVPVKAISNHVLSLVIKKHLIVNAETGMYTIAPETLLAKLQAPAKA